MRRQLALSTAFIALCGAAYAQDQGSIQLAPIIVEGADMQAYRATSAGTATLTDTPLRDVPQAVNVVGREEIEDRQIQSLSAAVEGVPNLARNGSAANRSETFLLRGFQTSGFSVDGMQMNGTADRPEVLMDLAGVERVEVLKGPASVLHGAGDPGGVINIVTRRPEAAPGADIALTYGSFDFKRAEATATGALNASGTLTGRITGAVQDEDGWIPGRPGSERRYVGGILEWRPSDATVLDFTLEHTATKQPFDRGLLWVPSQQQVLEPYDSWLSEAWSMVDGEKTRGMLKLEHEVSDRLTLRTSLGFDFGHVSDTGIDHQGLRDDGRSLRRRYTDRLEDTETQNLRAEALYEFSTGSVEHNVLAGVQYSWSRMDFTSARANIDDIDIFDPVHGAPMPATSPNSNYRQDIETRAVYLQDQITFNEEWKALIGLRWDEYTSERVETIGGDGSIPETTDTALTGRIGVVWQPRGDLSLYASYAESFAPQTGLTRDLQTLDPEEGRQYEVGAKWDVVPDRLSANLSVFEITKTNLANDDPLDEDYSILTGEVRSRGIEAELAGEVLPGWGVHAGLGYLDAEVTKDNVIPVGTRFQRVPRVTASLWTTYEFQPGSVAEGFTVGGGITHVGSRVGFIDDNYADQFEVDGYTRLDLMTRYTFDNGATLSLAVNNVTDEGYINSIQSEREIVAGAPRNVQLKLGMSF
ncbi:TonB-dependent siderophore receptor [Falsirhodobacter xinxiangensis]|uniref:TonB-dependent siderophore receptor n=1 Tax=Falsirhodobacter xinxiangensis TaxID=2530049 RepID=UPI0010AAF26C|nr:TonB-dependent siderophore receptor [Rhodobacter xinxiangensis]